ncbi:TIGR01459 family HAD-type hydrolase [Azospirillum brasilense]|uniref:TIGR01459 family HAD-type hydrolase n=1 Tax=Azospirillum brasilense TaxID=192 RepID=A0A0P0F1Z5_AZOBR|nr:MULTISPECIES: TIGR01459 family HAD-type hydrolase [Azospirillum]ALJ34484.1 HAD family hydrolase [Azospirillum brasilense]MDW7554173.1 TIGR01459 family HAD-type hydrolase [Azospirillum brasilense]MDW7593568.1 TIGR01459 family HAD-type hydrolase [Azospirillum brasilense]MDW7627189.1 TIGR01459 family HAD-type hydrolase [Azospirillum brasilense]MDX5953107.1 TIGR01459 family HAD-type hydrolase [Azospirillum brasilense]
MTDIVQLSGIAPVIDRYDGVILDLWGVLHDGERPYPGVPECLDRLRAAGKVICLLSNAPRRTGGVIAKLDGMGIGRERYHHVMTSGEAAYDALRDRDDPWHAALGRRLFHIGPDRDMDVYEGLDYTLVASPDEADFVVNTGIVDFGESLSVYEPALEACRRRNLPMVCANPDLIVMVGEQMVICAGTLAQRYQAMGGNVFWHGKPHAPVYDRCLSLMGIKDKGRILAVGDSLRTDVAGANAAGIDVALVTFGIHREELGGAWGEAVDPAKLAAAAAAAGHQPTYGLPSLRW